MKQSNLDAGKTLVNKLANNFQLVSFTLGVLLGSLLIGYIMHNHYANYYLVHNTTNLGGLVFKEGKVFSLTELQDGISQSAPAPTSMNRK